MKTPSTGFTLLELVVVILLMGILAFELVPRLSGTSAYDARGYFDQAANGLR
ncbi:MAG: prepilin-type N-terminal cleavage/methylation domain-containing protein, partial [Gammaproteobacteria bacterium]